MWPAAVTIFLGCLTPVTTFLGMRYIGRFSLADSAGVAAHYGSVSAVTFNHLLGETGVCIFGTPALARSVQKNFPKSLHDAPLLLQTPNTMLRQSLDQWFEVHGIQPQPGEARWATIR